MEKAKRFNLRFWIQNWLTFIPVLLMVLMVSALLGLYKAGALKFEMSHQELKLMPITRVMENDPIQIKQTFQKSHLHLKREIDFGSGFRIIEDFTYDELIKKCGIGEHEIFVIINPGRFMYYGEFELK